MGLFEWLGLAPEACAPVAGMTDENLLSEIKATADIVRAASIAAAPADLPLEQIVERGEALVGEVKNRLFEEAGKGSQASTARMSFLLGAFDEANASAGLFSQAELDEICDRLQAFMTANRAAPVTAGVLDDVMSRLKTLEERLSRISRGSFLKVMESGGGAASAGVSGFSGFSGAAGSGAAVTTGSYVGTGAPLVVVTGRTTPIKGITIIEAGGRPIVSKNDVMVAGLAVGATGTALPTAVTFVGNDFSVDATVDVNTLGSTYYYTAVG